jgi:hypothetical protein
MKFLVDRMLGKLAKKLRMLGYDAVYYGGEDPHRMIRMAREDGRVILTRNSRLVPKRPEDRIIRVAEDEPLLQLQALLQQGYIALVREKILSRCLLCNSPIEEIRREDAEGKVPDFIFYQQKTFFRCPSCRRIYWQGSHPERMQRNLEELFN